MTTIEVEGVKYKVTENLGYQNGAGLAKAVDTPTGERVAVKRGPWVWWGTQDRIQPLKEKGK